MHPEIAAAWIFTCVLWKLYILKVTECRKTECTLQIDTLQRQQQLVHDYSKYSHRVVNSSTTKKYLKFLNLIYMSFKNT